MGFLGFGVKDEPGKLVEYAVHYKGGHPDYPTARSGQIDLKMFDDRFELHPTMGTKKWFAVSTIPLSAVRDLQIVERQVSTIEGLLGGLSSRQLNQKNNIHITYEDPSKGEIVLRLEMLLGITVMGQAGKCQEFEDRIRNQGIRQKFRSRSSTPPLPEAADIPKQIEKLAELHKKGILSDEEFTTKKKDLLSRL